MAKENVLANSDMSDDELWDLHEDIKYEMGIENEDLDDIFQVAMLDRKNLFPNQNKNSEEKCLRNWINGYIQRKRKEENIWDRRCSKQFNMVGKKEA